MRAVITLRNHSHTWQIYMPEGTIMKLQLSESAVADLFAQCPKPSGDLFADAKAVLDVLAAGGHSVITRADATVLLGKMGSVEVKANPSHAVDGVPWALIGVALRARCVPVKGKRGFWTIRPASPSGDAAPDAADGTPMSAPTPPPATVEPPTSAAAKRPRRNSTKAKRGKV